MYSNVIVAAVAAVLTLITFGWYGRRKKPIISATVNMISGAGLLCAAAFVLAKTAGVMLEVNAATVFLSLTLGAPGVGLVVLFTLLV